MSPDQWAYGEYHCRHPSGALRDPGQEAPPLKLLTPQHITHRPLCPALLGTEGDPKRHCPSILQEGVGREGRGSLPPRLQVVQHQGGLDLRVLQEVADALLDLHRSCVSQLHVGPPCPLP